MREKVLCSHTTLNMKELLSCANTEKPEDTHETILAQNEHSVTLLTGGQPKAVEYKVGFSGWWRWRNGETLIPGKEKSPILVVGQVLQTWYAVGDFR